MRDTFNRMMGRTRYVVFRLFLHLGGSDVASILGVLNRAAREAIDADGDLEVLGEGLVEISESLLRYDEYWLSAANEGDVFWNEGEVGDYFNELFTDSAQRYGAEPDFNSTTGVNEPLSIPVTSNLIVMIAVAYEGEVPELETNLADIQAMKAGLKAIVNLHYNNKLRAIQVHFSPAQLGDELTNEQLLLYYPELIPLPIMSLKEIEEKYYWDLIPNNNIPTEPIKDHKIPTEPIKLFFSYASQDEELQKDLVKHLSILRRRGYISIWHKRMISPGAEKDNEINIHLNEADVILLLISADFLATDYCYDIELTRAMERHADGEACVIPVILREVDWKGAPFSKLQALPQNLIPVTSWANRDEAFANVVKDISTLLAGRN